MSTPPLQQLITDRYYHLGLSFRELSAKATDESGAPLVSHGTLSNLYRGAHKWSAFKPSVLQGIAKALDVPVAEVEKAARDSRGFEPQRIRAVPTELHDLSDANWEAVVVIATRLLREQRDRP